MPNLKILHIITGLNIGGAEMMLYKLLSYQVKRNYKIHVISLIELGAMAERLEDLNIPITSLRMHRRIFNNPFKIIRLLQLVKENSPDIVQTWMYHADLLGGVVVRLFFNIPIVWGIRHSNLDPKNDKPTTISIAKICANLSYSIPRKIISCSEVGRKIHISLGYDPNKIQVIPNGFDCLTWQPSSQARLQLREELEISSQTLLIGIVARFHPQKDHATFLEAAAILHAEMPTVHFVMCGRDIHWNNLEIVKRIEEAGIKNSCHLLGQREDIYKITAALDVASSSSSYGEGFPNVIGEAMSCGVPCVVTDVGDSGWILGNTGIVVPPKNPQALADAWKQLLLLTREERKQLGLAARKRILADFSLDSVCLQYDNLYSEVVKNENK
jgi:glycosyltransferase involved in cell wall biosynthesis